MQCWWAHGQADPGPEPGTPVVDAGTWQQEQKTGGAPAPKNPSHARKISKPPRIQITMGKVEEGGDWISVYTLN